MEAVGQLTGGIAHDLNNLLTVVLANSEMMAASIPEDRNDLQSDLGELQMAARRGAHMIRKLLSFSRHAPLTYQVFDLGKLVEDLIGTMRRLLPAHIEVVFSREQTPVRVLADAGAIEQIMLNLATNARDAMPRGGTLRLEARRLDVARPPTGALPGSYACLSVSDSGVGMDERVRARVFEPFFTTKPPGAGTGLGLSIVHGIMKSHQGAVELDSEPGRGTRVRCFFPALSAAPEEAIREPDPTPHGHGERVLLVEDDPSLARIGERRLVELGYAVTLETDSRRALERFRERPREFDLVITDYLMPSMVGIELARALIGIRSDIPIILLTGFMEDLPDQEIQAAGVRRLLQKPVSMHDLGVGVHEILTSFSRS
jgi:CheY-like chemotaxis protein